jgi:uncharacterized surface protein with fasciclin (FAS1) repeats
MRKRLCIFTAPAIVLLFALGAVPMRAQEVELTGSANVFVNPASAKAGRTQAVSSALALTSARQSPQSTSPRRPGARQSTAPEQNRRLVESLRAAGNFTTLLLVLDKAGLSDTLSNSTKGLTLFAPDDEAFALLPAVLVKRLTADPAEARAFILPYILNGKVMSEDLRILSPRRDLLRTFAGTSLQVSNNPGAGAGLTAKDSAGLIVIFDVARRGVGGSPTGWPCCGRVTSADHLTANGVYHEISFASASGELWR